MTIQLENLFSDKPLQKTAVSEWQTYRILEGDPFAGTNTNAEFVELERRMREYIESGLYAYPTMENQLISHGYGQEKIRCTFKRLTGLTPEEFQNVNDYYAGAPSTIPRLTIAWGLAKKGKDEAYFIQPWLLGFAIFHQVDECTRNIIAEFECRTEALDGLAKYVKEVHTHNAPMDLKTNKPDLRNINEPRIGVKTGAARGLLEQFAILGEAMQASEKLSLIKHAFNEGEIPEEDFIALLKAAGFRLLAEDSKGEDVLPEVPSVASAMNETSQDVLDETQEPTAFPLSSAVNELSNFVAGINENLENERVLVKAFKYVRKDGSGYNANIDLGDQKPEEFFNNNGLMSLVLECRDTAQNIPPKFGVAVFSVVDKELVTSGQFKGQDDKMYSFNAEGVKQYLKP